MISFILTIVAISLLIDAFSLSLIPASSKLKNNEILWLSLIIGTFNLIIIWIGFLFGDLILKFIPISSQLLVSSVLLYMGLQMVLESKKSRLSKMNEHFFKLILFSLVFSIDNISLGVSLNYLSHNHFVFTLMIAFVSILFSFVALTMSKLINESFFDNSKLIAGIILIIISIVYVLV